MGDDWASVCRHETVTMRVFARYETVLISLDQLILSETEVPTGQDCALQDCV